MDPGVDPSVDPGVGALDAYASPLGAGASSSRVAVGGGASSRVADGLTRMRQARWASSYVAPPGITSVARRLHGGCTAVTRRLHGSYTAVTRRLHGGYTAVTRRLHGGYTAVARPGITSVPTRTRRERRAA